MTDNNNANRRDAHAPLSARLIVVGAVLAVMSAFALLDAARFFARSWRASPGSMARRDRAAEISGALAGAVERPPAGSTVLVLLTPRDFRELVYAFYHSPPGPGMPARLPLSAPDSQIPVFVQGRQALFALYDAGEPGVVRKSIRAYNSKRTANPIVYAVAVSWGPSPTGEVAAATLYDAQGNRVK